MKFPSAISRYLVSNLIECDTEDKREASFHPLYRGTWFPTAGYNPCNAHAGKVSIRYIAVLGFQLKVLVENYRKDDLVFPSAISRYLVSNTDLLCGYRLVI